jgi:hypothetical protein
MTQALMMEGSRIANLPPKGLSRHDGVVETLSRRLRTSPFAAVRYLRCEFRDGVLTLSGRVPTFYTKQIALSLACSSPGVDLIIDLLEVCQPARAMA